MSSKKVICWDLDETLGSFRRIGYELAGVNVPQFERPVSLKHGIIELLSDLSSQGYLHFVTTAGSFDYANEALKRTGLINQFQKVFGRDDISTEIGKQYRPVIKNLNLSDEEAVSNVIIIGDSPKDKPIDLDGLVFVEHTYCLYTDSSVTAMILKKLNELGNNNFKRGFEKMYENAKIENEEFGGYKFEQRKYDINNDIKLEVKYSFNDFFKNNEEKTIPTITNILAETYRRDPILNYIY